MNNIFLLTASHVENCIIYTCSPGLSARNGTDAKVIEHCVDADVLVYVCDGKATFETGVSTFVELPVYPVAIALTVYPCRNRLCLRK